MRTSLILETVQLHHVHDLLCDCLTADGTLKIRLAADFEACEAKKLLFWRGNQRRGGRQERFCSVLRREVLSRSFFLVHGRIVGRPVGAPGRQTGNASRASSGNED